MAVCRINPITDQRWQALIERHRDASIFHTSEWLEALRRTYGYEPVAYAIQRGQELVNGMPFCRIRSRFTGRRLVSLPFSDHCQPLVESCLELEELLSAVQEDGAEQRCRYFEIRPLINVKSNHSTGNYLKGIGPIWRTIQSPCYLDGF